MDILSWIIPGIMVGVTYGLIAGGFVLIYKATGVFNIAQGEMVMLGGLLLFTFATELHLPLWFSIIVVLLLSAALGFVVQRIFIQPMIGQPVFSSFMTTIAFAMAIRSIAVLKWGAAQVGVFTLFPAGMFSFAGVSITSSRLYAFLISLVLFGALLAFFQFTKSGLLMRATSEDHQTAEGVGISVRRITAQIWIIAFVVAALGGIVLASLIGVSNDIADLGLVALPVAMLAGLESLGGALLGGIIVGVVSMLASGYLDPYTEGGMGQLMPYVAMLFILLVRPHGLFGWKRIERV